MSQYNKTVLTALGLDLAKRANAGQATFKVTKVATSADDLGDISVEQLERMTEIPNIMQYGTITDAEPLESDNAVIGVSLRFTNKGLNNGYKIRLVGLYVREAGQQQDILYAVTTAKEPEYMPDFKDQVLYRFNLQMYVVVGRAQSVSILVDDTTIVSVKNFNDYKTRNDKRVDKNIQDIAQLRQDFEDNKEVVKENIANAGQVKTIDGVAPDASGDVKTGRYTNEKIDQKISEGGKVRTVNKVQPDGSGDVTIDTGVTSFNGQKGDINFSVIHKDYASPQDAYNASAKSDGIHIYDPDDGPQSVVIGDETITVSSNHDAIINLQSQNGDLSRRIDTVDSKVTDATNLAKSNLAEINTLKETKPDMSGYVTQEEFQNATLGFKISQSDYDKLPSEQKQKDRVVYLING